MRLGRGPLAPRRGRLVGVRHREDPREDSGQNKADFLLHIPELDEKRPFYRCQGVSGGPSDPPGAPFWAQRGTRTKPQMR